jgi:hypothetical protein
MLGLTLKNNDPIFFSVFFTTLSLAPFQISVSISAPYSRTPPVCALLLM